MKRISLSRGAVGLLTAITLTAGCTSTNSDDAAASNDGTFDLCTLLSTEELTEGGYLETSYPVTVTKHLAANSSPDVKEGVATCDYGTWEHAGLTLSVPLGNASTSPRDFVDGAGFDANDGEELKLSNGAKAFYDSKEFTGTAIAFEHGGTPVMLQWQQVDFAGAKSQSADEMSRLAETVIKRLPQKLELPVRDLPKECEGLEEAAKQLVGEVTAARGSADVDNLYCDFAGPAGIQKAAARTEDRAGLDSFAKIFLVKDEYKTQVDIADDATISYRKGFSGVDVYGVIDDCCTIMIGLRPAEGGSSDDKKLNGKEQDFIVKFLDAAREWAK